jgi:hypothetical protein
VKYVLLFVEPEQYAKDLEAMDAADRDRAMLVGQWFMENSDKIRGGSKLRPRTPQPRCVWTATAILS